MNTNESATPISELLRAAGDAIPEGAKIAVGGDPTVAGPIPWDLRPFGAGAPETFDEEGRPHDSAEAIVALERDRAGGVDFLALSGSANHWLEEFPLFGDHCRSRYDVIFESADLGAVLHLCRPAAADSERSEKTHEGARGDDATTVEPEGGLDALDTLAVALARFVRDGGYSGKIFRRFERHGVHVTPVHFYSPIPDTAQLGDHIWQKESGLIGVDMNDEMQLHLVSEIFPQFRDEYESLPSAPSEDPSRFYLGNGLFDGTDALVLYCMLRYLKPRRVLEVGAGFSTRLAAQAVLANGPTELVCVDPFPDPVLQEGIPGLTTLIPSRVEELPMELFLDLQENDVLFIDSSHVARIGGDVTFLFLEVLPRLQPGVVVQVHDVFLPFEYGREWVVDALRFWNEQYVLQAFLAFNSAFRVLVANSYLNVRHSDVLRATFPTSPWWGGGSFWFQRQS